VSSLLVFRPGNCHARVRTLAHPWSRRDRDCATRSGLHWPSSIILSGLIQKHSCGGFDHMDDPSSEPALITMWSKASALWVLAALRVLGQDLPKKAYTGYRSLFHDAISTVRGGANYNNEKYLNLTLRLAIKVTEPRRVRLTGHAERTGRL
jgi:hypothetical protein